MIIGTALAERLTLLTRDAQILDPQQRIFLECAWEALEDAGYDPSRYDDPIGVFAGADQSGYQFNIYASHESQVCG